MLGFGNMTHDSVQTTAFYVEAYDQVGERRREGVNERERRYRNKEIKILFKISTRTFHFPD